MLSSHYRKEAVRTLAPCPRVQKKATLGDKVAGSIKRVGTRWWPSASPGNCKSKETKEDPWDVAGKTPAVGRREPQVHLPQADAHLPGAELGPLQAWSSSHCLQQHDQRCEHAGQCSGEASYSWNQFSKDKMMVGDTQAMEDQGMIEMQGFLTISFWDLSIMARQWHPECIRHTPGNSAGRICKIFPG